MATRNKITEMVALVKTIYSYYAKDANVPLLVQTWEALLKDYSDETVGAAFYTCLQTCKTPPTPADVIEQLRDKPKAMPVRRQFYALPTAKDRAPSYDIAEYERMAKRHRPVIPKERTVTDDDA